MELHRIRSDGFKERGLSSQLSSSPLPQRVKEILTQIGGGFPVPAVGNLKCIPCYGEGVGGVSDEPSFLLERRVFRVGWGGLFSGDPKSRQKTGKMHIHNPPLLLFLFFLAPTAATTTAAFSLLHTSTPGNEKSICQFTTHGGVLSH